MTKTSRDGRIKEEASLEPATPEYAAFQQDASEPALDAACMGMAAPAALKQEEGTDSKGTGVPKAHIVRLTVNRSSYDDKLGMDVKHVNRGLVIVEFFQGGALERSIA